MQTAREYWFLLLSIPFYTILIGAEILVSNWGHKKYYSVKGVVQNILLTIINAGLDLLLRTIFVIAILTWSYKQHFFTISNPYLYWLLLFVLEDFAFYIEHRVDHYCRLFWAVHLTHHSSEEFNLSTGFRSSVFQPVYRFVYFIPLTLMGFEPIDILFMYSVTQTYGIIVHTRYIQKLPAFIEAIFVTPAHHRVHHASNIIYLDKNMGMCLIIWDRMFGTFQDELPEEPVVYGLTTPLENPDNALNHVAYEWKKMYKDMKRNLPFVTKIKYLLMPPGWSHDGSTKTAVQLRKELKSVHT
jgi:sterol desaturase/sphingolipid hydroxylase (fatty acid hydroxylase superfamily)